MKFLILLVLFVVYAKAAPKSDGNLELIILHNNDMHARFEQTNINGNKCTQTDADADKCFGGFARVAHEVREYRKEAENGGIPVLYLNAGDTYTGTPWFQLFKDNITAAFLNKLKPDATSLGNHEFDEGTEILGKFLDEINFPVLVTNINFDNEPALQNENLKKSHIFEIGGHKIGVIGYLTPETNVLAKDNKVDFGEEIEAINKEAQVLKTQGVNILIALGHSGIEKDKQIAAECHDIDLVIGGHSHTFLYTGEPPSNDVPFDVYPIVITQHDGKHVPVVQAKSYTKYLGKLHLEFDNNGNLIEFDGTPILLNGTIQRELDLVELLDVYRPAIIELENQIVGETKVKLDGTCRFKECNLGNLIADSMVDWYTNEIDAGEYWTDASIGIMNSGGIRASIDNPGNITMEDIITILPFESKIVVVNITGKELYEVLEHSVWRYENGIDNGEFLQYSGVFVKYDINRPSGRRVVEAKIVCAKCSVPALVDIDLNMEYKVVLLDYVADGGDGYEMLKGKTIYNSEKLDTYVLNEYLKKKSPVVPAVEWRVTIEPINDLTEVVGLTKVQLDSSECSKHECNIGNFIADSIVDFYASQYNEIDNWTDAPIALILGKHILTSVDPNHNITRGVVLKMLGSIQYLHVKEVNGSQLKEIIEFALTTDIFLQVSGLEIRIDVNKPEGERVTDLKVICAECQSPVLETVVNEKKYKILMQAPLAISLDSFYENSDSIEIQETDLEIVVKYLKKKSPVYPAVERRVTEVVGATKVRLDHSECKKHECNIGNFITDSIVDFYASQHNESDYWTDASVAIVVGKNIMTSVDRDHEITRANVINIFGSTHNLHIKEVSGSELKEIIEYALTHDMFLQASGLEIKIDMNNPEGERVTSLKVICADCHSPDLETVVNEKKYKILMQAPLAFSLDSVFKNSGSMEIEETDVEAVVKYLMKKSPVFPAVEWRIEVIEKRETTDTTTESTTSIETTMSSTISTTESTSTTTQGASTLILSFALLALSLLINVKF